MISLRRTRQSSWRLANASPRTTNTVPPASTASDATVSSTFSADGNVPAIAPTRTSAILMASPTTIARPGSVRRSACFTPRYYMVSLADREARTRRAIQYSLSARRPDTRSLNWRNRHPDLSDLYLCAGSARPSQRVRVRAHAESDPGGARGQHRGHGKGQGGVRVRVGNGGDRCHHHAP